MAAQLIVALSLGLFVATFCQISVPCTTPAEATSCPNVLGDILCEALFGTTDAQQGQNPACTNSSFADFVKKCQKQCWTCCKDPAYASCKDPIGGPTNCPDAQKAGLCEEKDEGIIKIMKEECPSTCGLCSTSTSSNPNCKDTNSNCAILASGGRCKNVDHIATMRANCAATCNLCDSSSTNTGSTNNGSTNTGSTNSGSTNTGSTNNCVNIATNCEVNKGLCNNSAYLSLMTQKCPVTCGKCSSTGTGGSSSTCSDLNPNCATWVKNGFCENPGYTTAYKKQYCPGSCKLC